MRRTYIDTSHLLHVVRNSKKPIHLFLGIIPVGENLGSEPLTNRCQAEVLHEKPENVPGLKIVAAYGAYTEHLLYYVVEADDIDAVEKFLTPGFTRCKAAIAPVSQFFG